MTFTFVDEAYRPIRASLGEYGRGIAGGLIFSMPLLYTMELWQTGHRIEPERLIAAMIATFVVLLGYNRYAGLREDASLAEVVIDSFEELGLGVVLSAVMLWMMGLFGNDQPLEMQIERLVVEALVTAIGVSVGTAQLNASEEDSGINEDKDDEPSLGSNITLGVCGSLLLATSIAPTDEVPIIATSSSAPKLIGMLLLACFLAGTILLYSLQRGEQQDRATPLELAMATALTVTVALAVSAMLLWFFNRFDGRSLYHCVALTIVLGVPASLGAAAGRLLLE
ncbi:MAG TPA: TIGR02587 family membrane protein [Roseiflexaceae bacterium]|nr:TIGR02587 family membrane protein [Roseiflexaceae bacterium]